MYRLRIPSVLIRLQICPLMMGSSQDFLAQEVFEEDIWVLSKWALPWALSLRAQGLCYNTVSGFQEIK